MAAPRCLNIDQHPPYCRCGEGCEVCAQPVEALTEYQSHVGKTWRGHKGCTEAEAARWVVVERADVLRLMKGTREQQAEAYDRLQEALDA